MKCKNIDMPLINDSITKGQEAQLKVELRANDYGYIVSRPSISARYDLLFDNGKKIYKIQVKYCDCFRKNSPNQTDLKLQKGRLKKYNRKEIDAVIVYIKRTNEFFWFPPSIFNNKTALRFSISEKSRNKKNSYVKKYIW